jgi:formylglycine-generating enzyme required for sulfatase activity
MTSVYVAWKARRRVALLLVVGCAVFAQEARAAVVFDNFDGGGGFHAEFNSVAAEVFIPDPFFPHTVRAAARFTVSGGPYTLDSITLPISVSKFGTSDNILRVRLTADASGAPGATLEILSENQGVWPNLANPFTTTTTLTSTSHPTLANGSSYWIVTEPTAIPAGIPLHVDYRWFLNTSGSSVSFRQQQENSASLPADPWPGSATTDNVAFRVEGTPSPPPPLVFDWVTIGNPGNACDTQTQGCFGAIAYSYQIGKYEVTNAQYAAFLNAVADEDTHGLYNSEMGFDQITRTGISGSFTYATVPGNENKPITSFSFYDALRFANWLHNGQPTGAQGPATTEDGAYTFPTVARNAGAKFALPTENEWYKAAYYNAATAAYFDYPAGSDIQTTCSAPTATPNHANCSTGGAIQNVGSYTGSPSPYGTFDQGGNVWEWNETSIGMARGVRGGNCCNPNSTPLFLAASFQTSNNPSAEENQVGFRVVPEPGAVLQLGSGVAALLALARLRASRPARGRRARELGAGRARATSRRRSRSEKIPQYRFGVL